MLPDLGEGLTSGEIVSWLVAVGDAVEVDQPVAEIETAKAVVEVPSPFAGTVATLHAEVGGEVEVGTPLVTVDLDTDGAAGTDGGEPSLGGRAVVPQTGPGATPDDAATGEMVPDARPDRPVDGPEQPTVSGDDGGSGNVLVGYGTGGASVSRRRRQRDGGRAGPARSAPPPAPAAPSRPRAKPPVRKLARDRGVDLATVTGSGPAGVITREDVEAAAGNGHDRGATPVTARAPAPDADDGSGVPASEDYQQLLRPGSGGSMTDIQPPATSDERRIPVRGVRKLIADKMTVSRREIPEATTWVDVDATPLWDLREALNAEQTDVKVSPLAIVLRACVAGLRSFPEVNARLDTVAGEIVVPRHVNLGFAAQTERGLVVPVIKGADRMSLLGIAAELNRLAAAARDARIAPDELRGGTFSVSNYGSFGVDGGSAVINHPEAAILGVGRIADKPWVVDGAVAVRKVLQLSIAFDHRICDGAEAAGFLRLVADMIESPTKLVASL